ncbi:organic cation transporter protein [Bombus affinis]|uniref:organic cation transporter protein n=1 Tax=Bombus affinis TaxID=309941 RepID=UPI0021B7AEF9|nr:organic cation transporter protein [Bombus affinis]XP_050599606.1 organic cation transporter protein [Bombus affinis]XP_050599641.1 organic cation transporter protein [Bombus affinis]XP_050599683.1 organic cation transporter protein [Bombus affinis]XP_050599747.1 organic cation transporter protein [Bombus affinis]XP_050599770.1 organic cation transporter protein [Bombus affinis]XP_050599797.1 organic cation transporter protein [Bombus affinis]XP_050599852.1 organic cation transporter prot
MASVDKNLEELMMHLGEFGKYQCWQFCLHILGALTAGLHMLTLLTVAAVPPHTCNVPRSTFSTESFNFTSSTWNSSIAFDDVPRAVDACHYLDANNVTKECDSWTYDTEYFQSSRGMEWNFVCSQRWMGAAAQSCYMFGVFIGAVTLGSLADKYGRKIIFYVSAVAQLVFGVTVALVNKYYVFLILRFLYGIFGSAGAYITGFVLTMELVGATKRTVCGIMFQLAFAVGFMLVAVWGAVIKDRMWLQIVYGLHSVLLIGHWWLMDESPRWLWAQGRVSEALTIIRKGLKMNGNNVDIDTGKLISEGKIRQMDQEEQGSYGALDLFKTPNLRKKTLNVCLNWFANSIVYYGLSLNAGNLVGNPYLMLFLSGLVELPSYLLMCFLMDRTGRRCLVSTFMLIGGVCCIIASSIPTGTDTAATIIVTIVLFGKACIAGSFAVIYNYTAELFPTVVRNTALGIGSMCARFSGALTPLIMLLDSLNPKVPAVLFGFVALVSGFLSLYLPETVNQPMPETIEDGENFGKHDTCFAMYLRSGRKTSAAYEATQLTQLTVDTDEKEKLNEGGSPKENSH